MAANVPRPGLGYGAAAARVAELPQVPKNRERLGMSGMLGINFACPWNGMAN
jgi:hypothetical protein